jgi:hypothetical protein
MVASQSFKDGETGTCWEEHNPLTINFHDIIKPPFQPLLFILCRSRHEDLSSTSAGGIHIRCVFPKSASRPEVSHLSTTAWFGINSQKGPFGVVV